MEEFYIYKVKDEFINLFKKYPRILEKLSRQRMDSYHFKQFEMIFDNHQEVNQFLYEEFNQREDYTYSKNIHYLRNKVTGARSLIKIYPHCIYGYCSKDFHILVNIILQSSSNYVIINR
ncbi:MAG: sporulation inhibitor of replication protein SirA [Erysipelotrichaceae bacterium]|nr:sporulation inhibitor of replication protein SirA [Erysipelotrichaceae bacterium]